MNNFLLNKEFIIDNNSTNQGVFLSNFNRLKKIEKTGETTESFQIEVTRFYLFYKLADYIKKSIKNCNKITCDINHYTIRFSQKNINIKNVIQIGGERIENPLKHQNYIYLSESIINLKEEDLNHFLEKIVSRLKISKSNLKNIPLKIDTPIKNNTINNNQKQKSNVFNINGALNKTQKEKLSNILYDLDSRKLIEFSTKKAVENYLLSVYSLKQAYPLIYEVLVINYIDKLTSLKSIKERMHEADFDAVVEVNNKELFIEISTTSHARDKVAQINKKIPILNGRPAIYLSNKSIQLKKYQAQFKIRFNNDLECIKDDDVLKFDNFISNFGQDNNAKILVNEIKKEVKNKSVEDLFYENIIDSYCNITNSLLNCLVIQFNFIPNLIINMNK